MDRPSELNPQPWRHDDAQLRLSVPLAPVSELASVLRASYEVKPLPAEMGKLLGRLR